MKLEDIIRMYGTICDYQDPNTGNIYKLSSITKPDNEGNQKVLVYDYNNNLIGQCTVNMNKY